MIRLTKRDLLVVVSGVGRENPGFGFEGYQSQCFAGLLRFFERANAPFRCRKTYHTRCGPTGEDVTASREMILLKDPSWRIGNILRNNKNQCWFGLLRHLYSLKLSFDVSFLSFLDTWALETWWTSDLTRPSSHYPVVALTEIVRLPWSWWAKLACRTAWWPIAGPTCCLVHHRNVFMASGPSKTIANIQKQYVVMIKLNQSCKPRHYTP